MIISSLSELAKRMIADVDEETIFSVSAICLYDEAAELLAELIKNGHNIAYCELYSSIVNDYEYEFYISIDGCEVYVEPIRNMRGKFKFNIGDTIVYVHEDCKSSMMKHINSDAVYVFSVKDEEDDEEFDIDFSPIFNGFDYNKYANEVIDLTNKEIQSLMQEFDI